MSKDNVETGLEALAKAYDTGGRFHHTRNASEYSAFGEVLIAEITPIVQLQSAYNINTRIIDVRDNNGTSSISNSMFQVSTGAGANQSSSLFSKTAVKYNAGQGGLARFTAIFSTGVPGSSQIVGIGSSGEGYYFEYNGAAFGILRRQGGAPEVRRLTVSNKSTTAENITITLDGDAVTDVAVSDATATDVTTTANEIADHDYSNVGLGWSTHVMGDKVFFESYNPASKTGTYSLSGSAPVAGTFAQSVAGVAPTATRVAQTDWNADAMDGTGPSGFVLDQTKGNVYQIRYQWLGFGAINYYIEDPTTGMFVLVHMIQYGNANTAPSVDNPTMPLCMSVENTSNTSDITLKTASMLGAIEGKNLEEGGVFNALVLETTGITTTETPVISIHNHNTYKGKINRVAIRLDVVSASFDASAANKPAVLRITSDAELTGASFSPVDSNTSVVHSDTSATAITGGKVLFSQSLAEGSAPVFDFADRNIIIHPNETLTISLEASNNTIDPIVSLGWKELF